MSAAFVIRRIVAIDRSSVCLYSVVNCSNTMPVSVAASPRGVRRLLTACTQAVSASLGAGIQYIFNRRFFSGKPKKNKFTVSIEGNIGSGKTSLLRHFMKNNDIEVLMEPVDKWRNIDGHNALAAMYKDPSRFALTFQTYVQLTMVEAHTSPTHKRVKLMERSIYSAKYCFVENLYKSGKMPEIEYIILTKWFDWIIENGNIDLDLIVYLRTKPETAHERIKRRCRKEETAISLEYLQQLHQLHEDWLIHKTEFSLPCPVLVIEADKELEDMEREFDFYQQQILCRNQ